MDLNEIEKEIQDIKKGEDQRLDAHKELRKERNNHKEQLSKLEVEIQVYKSGYQSLMKKWEDEINGVQEPDKIIYGRSSIQAYPFTNNYLQTEPSRFSASSSTRYPQVNQISVSRAVPQSNPAGGYTVYQPLDLQSSIRPITYQNSVNYTPSSNQIGNEYARDFAGSSYASRYLSKDFRHK